MNNLTLKTVLVGTAAVTLSVLALLACVSYYALYFTSAAAFDMGRGKDVVADILPPPLYVIESQLVSYDLMKAPAAKRDALIAQLTELKKQFDARNAFWEQEELDAGVKASLLGEQRQQAERFWREVETSFLPAIRAGDMPRAEEALTKMRGYYEAHRLGVDATVTKANKYADDTLSALNRVSGFARHSVAALGLIGFLGVLACIIFLSRQIYLRVGGEPAAAMATTRNIAAGDLAGEDRGDTPGILGALSSMRTRLRTLISQVRVCGESVAAAAPRLLEQATQAQEAAKRQANDAESMAAAAEELSASVSSAADSAHVAQAQATASGEVAATAMRYVQEAVATMRDLAHSVDETATSVQELGKRSNEIGQVVQVINGVAEQTNLLALNAAIEAARAGESGRGFAVVADEVRKLAERTQRSTVEIGSMVTEIQRGIELVMRGIENAAATANAAAGTGDRAGTSMSQVEAAVSEVAAAVGAIATALAEQNKAATQVAQSVESVAHEAASTLEHAGASAEEARHLVDVSGQLRSATGQFRF